MAKRTRVATTLNRLADQAFMEALSSHDQLPMSDLQRAMEAIKKGRKMIAERQKLIKIADHFELGWGVVAEYTTDELAEDSDDEKRLERAEKAAEQKAAKRRKKRTIGQLGKPRGSLRLTTPGVLVAAATIVPAPPFYRAGARPGTATPRPVGPCFGCGEMGHLRAHCLKAAENRKWYLFVGNDSSDDVRVDYQHDTVEGTTFEGVEYEEVDSGQCVDSESMGRSWEVDTDKSLPCVKGRLR